MANSRELDWLINEWTRTLDAAALEAALRGADIPHTRAFTVADIAADPQMRARGMVQEVQDGLLGPVLHPGVVPRVNATPNAPRSTGPAVGADNDAVLGALPGYDAARIAALRAEGVL